MAFDPFGKSAVASTLSSRMGAAPPVREFPSFIPPTPNAAEEAALSGYNAEVTVTAPVRAPSSAGSSVRKRREPTADDEAKKRAEVAKRHRQEGAVRLLQVWDKNKNVLKKESHFLGVYQFRNTLPDPPVEPKLLRLAVDLNEQASPDNFTLPQTRKHSIYNDPALGLEVNLMDPEEFFVQKRPAPLDPKDDALINQVHLLTKKIKSGRPRDRSKSNVPWLMTSTLLTNGAHEELYTAEIKRKAEDDEFEDPHAALERKFRVVFEQFERQFEEANDPSTQYVHPDASKRDSVHVVSAVPIIPSAALVGSKLTHASFDNEPLPVGRDPEVAREAREKSYLIDVEVANSVGRGMMHLMTNIVPENLAKRLLDDTAGGEEQHEEEEDDLEDLFADEEDQKGTVYRSMRNLGYKFGTESERLVWVEGGTSDAVEFAPIRFRLDLHELVAQNEGADQIADINKFTVKQVDMSEGALQRLMLKQEEMLEGDEEELEEEQEEEEEEDEHEGRMDVIVEDDDE